jgi:hypothetical protein
MPHHHQLIMSEETATQPQIKIAWLIGIVAAFAIFAAIAGYSARMTNDYSDYDQQRAEVRLTNLASVRKAENALLYPVDDQGKPTAEWVDQAKGTIRIPIEEAMDKEIGALKMQAPAVGNDINPPAPAAKPGAAPATPAGAPAAPAPAAKPKEAKK